MFSNRKGIKVGANFDLIKYPVICLVPTHINVEKENYGRVPMVCFPSVHAQLKDS